MAVKAKKPRLRKRAANRVNTLEARTDLPRLFERVSAGEMEAITKASKLAPLEGTGKRKLGFLRGVGTVPDDLNSFGREEIERMFFEPE